MRRDGADLLLDILANPAFWTAVLRIPFASLRFAEGRQDWRIMVARRLPREQFHLITSVPVPRWPSPTAARSVGLAAR